MSKARKIKRNPRMGGTFDDFLREEGIHEAVQTTAIKLAAVLKTNQTAVSRLENRTDMYLSSLGEYIRAMGGQLELRAKFKDFEIRIDPMLLSRK